MLMFCGNVFVECGCDWGFVVFGCVIGGCVNCVGKSG